MKKEHDDISTQRETLNSQEQLIFFAQDFVDALNNDRREAEEELVENYINKIRLEKQITFFNTCYLRALEKGSNESTKKKLLRYIKGYNPCYNEDDFFTILLLKIVELNYSNALETLYISNKGEVEETLKSMGTILVGISNTMENTEMVALLNKYIDSLALPEPSDLIGEESLNFTAE